MKTIKKMTLIILIAIFALSFASCDDDIDDEVDLQVSRQEITGVTAPVTGATPVTTITTNNQYTGAVSWRRGTTNHTGAFEASTAYTAVIVLTIAEGYTFQGLAANFFRVGNAEVTSPVGTNASTLTVQAIFPATAAPVNTQITEREIPGVPVPVNGLSSAATINAEQFTGTVVWRNITTGNAHNGDFGANTIYGATITLSAKPGYTLTGVAANYFTVAGADTVLSSADSPGVIHVTFPQTTATPMVTTKAIAGVTIPANNATPVGTVTQSTHFTGTVKWSIAGGAPVPDNGTFQPSTRYIATITLTARTETAGQPSSATPPEEHKLPIYYQFQGLPANFFEVAGAVTSSPANGTLVSTPWVEEGHSGLPNVDVPTMVVTALFPPTPPAGTTQ